MNYQKEKTDCTSFRWECTNISALCGSARQATTRRNRPEKHPKAKPTRRAVKSLAQETWRLEIRLTTLAQHTEMSQQSRQHWHPSATTDGCFNSAHRQDTSFHGSLHCGASLLSQHREARVCCPTAPRGYGKSVCALSIIVLLHPERIAVGCSHHGVMLLLPVLLFWSLSLTQFGTTL